MAKKQGERTKGQTTESRTHVSFLISVRGIVQGVGFRPFIYQLAARHDLTGWVYNTSEDVRIKIEGPSCSVQEFLRELPRQAPPRAMIEQLSVSETEVSGCEDFSIRDSVQEDGKYQLVSPDIATCPDCRREIRPGQPPLPLSLHQLHQLRPPLHHHRGHPLRPAPDHHAPFPDVPRLPAGI